MQGGLDRPKEHISLKTRYQLVRDNKIGGPDRWRECFGKGPDVDRTSRTQRVERAQRRAVEAKFAVIVIFDYPRFFLYRPIKELYSAVGG